MALFVPPTSGQRQPLGSSLQNILCRSNQKEIMNQNEDEQYLKLLSIFHYVVGGIAGLFACFPIIHFVAGLGILISSLTQSSQNGPPALIGLIFTLFAGGFIFFGWAFAICIMLVGWFISKRKNHTFCIVMAGIECMFNPFGTVLGVFTIITLIRPSVKELFKAPIAQSG